MFLTLRRNKLSTTKLKRFKRSADVTCVSEVYVHISHDLSKVDLTEKEVLTAFKEDPPKPFELVRDFVEYLGFENVRGAKFEDAFFDEKNFVIEYSVESNRGRIGVRIICSEKPYDVLKKYYGKFDRSVD